MQRVVVLIMLFTTFLIGEEKSWTDSFSKDEIAKINEFIRIKNKYTHMHFNVQQVIDKNRALVNKPNDRTAYIAYFNFQDVADGESVQGYFMQSGTEQFITVLGAKKTVRTYKTFTNNEAKTWNANLELYARADSLNKSLIKTKKQNNYFESKDYFEQLLEIYKTGSDKVSTKSYQRKYQEITAIVQAGLSPYIITEAEFKNLKSSLQSEITYSYYLTNSKYANFWLEKYEKLKPKLDNSGTTTKDVETAIGHINSAIRFYELTPNHPAAQDNIIKCEELKKQLLLGDKKRKDERARIDTERTKQRQKLLAERAQISKQKKIAAEKKAHKEKMEAVPYSKKFILVGLFANKLKEEYDSQFKIGKSPDFKTVDKLQSDMSAWSRSSSRKVVSAFNAFQEQRRKWKINVNLTNIKKHSSLDEIDAAYEDAKKCNLGVFNKLKREIDDAITKSNKVKEAN